MVKPLLKVVIDDEAKLQIKEAYNYIKKDSIQNAEKVRSRIISSFKQLIKHPEKHPLDKVQVK